MLGEIKPSPSCLMTKSSVTVVNLLYCRFIWEILRFTEIEKDQMIVYSHSALNLALELFFVCSSSSCAPAFNFPFICLYLRTHNLKILLLEITNSTLLVFYWILQNITVTNSHHTASIIIGMGKVVACARYNPCTGARVTHITLCWNWLVGPIPYLLWIVLQRLRAITATKWHPRGSDEEVSARKQRLNRCTFKSTTLGEKERECKRWRDDRESVRERMREWKSEREREWERDWERMKECEKRERGRERN